MHATLNAQRIPFVEDTLFVHLCNNNFWFLIFIFFLSANIARLLCAVPRQAVAPRGSVFIQLGSVVDRTKPTLGQPGYVQSLVVCLFEVSYPSII